MLRIPTSAALIVLLAPTSSIAQHEQHVAASPASERLGTVEFETSCAPAVREDFNRAVALLHSFEFAPAIAAFDSVLSEDPSCAMAHWGIALSYWSNPFGGVRSTAALQSGSAAVERGRSTGSPTPRERAYIEAAARLFEDYSRAPQRDRILAYEQAMERLSRENPEDTEAAIFHALAINQTALPTDKRYTAQLEAAAILEPLVERYPDHPGLTHYIIHAYDHPPLAPLALEAARRYAEIAPSAPHALHMPSHTFTRVGSWKESAQTNLRSEQTAVEQGATTEALHAMDYQTYAYLQMAQDESAQQVLDRLPSVAAKFDPNGIGGAAPPMAGFFAMTAMPARYALERSAWREAAQLPIPSSGTPFTIAMTHFARALGAARGGDPGAAVPDLERLAELRDALLDQNDAYWAEQVDIQLRAARAWVAFAEGRRDEAIQMLQAAAQIEDGTDKSAVTPGPLAPAHELLGEMLLEAGYAEAALVEFEASIAKEPGRFRGNYGAARAAEAAGNRAKALAYFQGIAALDGDADVRRLEVEHALNYVNAGG